MTFPQIRKSDGLLYLGIFLILAAYVVAVIRLHPTNFFGLFEDDSIYFSSAKALAQGQGYVLPSVPGTPPATKYPILYPVILSLVWRWDSSFPSNLAGAVGITVAFGMAYILAGFVFLRRLKSFNDFETVLLTGFCALHPLVLFFSGNVLSDIPFAALALAAMVLGDRFLESDAKYRAAMVCGLVVGLCLSMRVFGIAVVAGIFFAGMAKRAWKKTLIFATFVSPFFLFIIWRAVFASTVNVPLSGFAASSLGWQRAWAYYTSYVGMWKLSVPNTHIFWAMVLNNLQLVVQSPADLFLQPLFVSDTMIGRALMLLVSALSFAGIIRQGLASGWRVVHFIVPFFAVIMLLWNYSDAGNRFLLSFYFLLIAGFWIEIKHICALLRNVLSSPAGYVAEKVLASVLALGILILGSCVAFNYAFGRRRDVYDLSQRHGSILKAKREAYRWLAQTDGECCAPVLAVEDANLFLYSGRQAVSPVLTFVTSTLYEDAYVNESVDHLLDVAKAVRAQLWVFADDDFSMESKNVALAVRKCLGRDGPGDWPEVFRSSDGRVVIRSLSATGYASPCHTPLKQSSSSVDGTVRIN